jgi:hypothetical protein
VLARLNKSQRWKAGWCVALAYLFCVLAPTASFAFADGSRSAPCIVEDHGPGLHVHEHHHESFRDNDANVHDHGNGVLMAREGMARHDAGAPPAKESQKTADTRCCGLVSLSAIPAGEITLAKPSAPSSRCETESCRDIADNTPPRLYRPPIS